MQLLERENCLEALEMHYRQVDKEAGHVIFISGEAGIGKTFLVDHFLRQKAGVAATYAGSCDSLYTPRPLGPLYDVASQIGPHFTRALKNGRDRAHIFDSFIQEIASTRKTVILVFEDIHWADAATIDFIKLLARRIARYHCMFILTYRDNEVHDEHPLRRIFAEMSPATYSHLTLDPLSPETVRAMATAQGYDADKVYSLTGGNPFYVTEILAKYSQGIPEKIKDSILTNFRTRPENVKVLWELLSVFPSEIESDVIEKLEPSFAAGIENCIHAGIVVRRQNRLSFKHELFRMAIAESLSQQKSRELHGRVLSALLATPEYFADLSLLVHHALLSDNKKMLSQITPMAAREAALVGAHAEAARLYKTTIEFTDRNDPGLGELLECHAHECYLTNQIDDAIAAQQAALAIWQEKKLRKKEGDALRVLSRLMWWTGKCSEVMTLSLEAVRILETEPPSRELAHAYCNLCQLQMLSDDVDKTKYWGDKTITLAGQLVDEEARSSALNSIGTVLMKFSDSTGEQLIEEALTIAFHNGLHEQIAEGYTNLSSMLVLSRRYEEAHAIFQAGLKYCETRDLSAWSGYMYGEQVAMLIETGEWDRAEEVALTLIQPNSSLLPRIQATVALARLKMRRGQFDKAKALVENAITLAIPTLEAHSLVPAIAASLELCWLTGDTPSTAHVEMAEKELFPQRNDSWYYSELAYWMRKCHISIKKDITYIGPLRQELREQWQAAACDWSKAGCEYRQALALSEGTDEDQRQSLLILDRLGATAVAAKIKSEMKLRGVQHIPRGPRRTTRSNAALLTGRQIEVLELLREGSQNKEIADRLFISPKTVDHHISAILAKLEVSSRAKAVAEAHKLGILK